MIQGDKFLLEHDTAYEYLEVIMVGGALPRLARGQVSNPHSQTLLGDRLGFSKLTFTIRMASARSLCNAKRWTFTTVTGRVAQRE